jgi:hypothetical protein
MPTDRKSRRRHLDPFQFAAQARPAVVPSAIRGDMPETVAIAGVGPGLGESLARKFVAEGCRVALLAGMAPGV